MSEKPQVGLCVSLCPALSCRIPGLPSASPFSLCPTQFHIQSPIHLCGDWLRISGHLTAIFHSSYNFSGCSQAASRARVVLMGPGEGGSQGGALLQHGLDFSFFAGVLGSVEVVLASQDPVIDLERWGHECRQKETKGHCSGCWVGRDWWEWGVNPKAWVSSEPSWASSKQTPQLGS